MASKKDKIIVHCSDTPSTMDVTVDDLYQWHVKENGWSAIGYAYFIDRQGVVHKCRDLDNDGDVEDETGAHTKGFNRGSIGICLAGRGEYTDAQFDALELLCDEIRSRHGIPVEKIFGHYHFAKWKTCPMFDVEEFRTRRD